MRMSSLLVCLRRFWSFPHVCSASLKWSSYVFLPQLFSEDPETIGGTADRGWTPADEKLSRSVRPSRPQGGLGGAFEDHVALGRLHVHLASEPRASHARATRERVNAMRYVTSVPFKRWAVGCVFFSHLEGTSNISG